MYQQKIDRILNTYSKSLWWPASPLRPLEGVLLCFNIRNFGRPKHVQLQNCKNLKKQCKRQKTKGEKTQQKAKNYKKIEKHIQKAKMEMKCPYDLSEKLLKGPLQKTFAPHPPGPPVSLPAWLVELWEPTDPGKHARTPHFKCCVLASIYL